MNPFNLNNILRNNLKTLVPYTSAREEPAFTDGSVLLDANESPYGNLNRYPDPFQAALKSKLAELKGIPVKNMFIGNGSDEIIDLVIRAFCVPGKDRVLTFTPSYGMYEVLAAINDIEVLKCPLYEDFQIDLEATLKLITDERLKIIFICSPNNPTGNCMKKETIRTLLDKFQGILLIDEAYIDFSTASSWITKTQHYPNLVVIQTMSKAWALAAARIGTAYANQSIVTVLNKIKLPYNVSRLNQMAGISALENQERQTNQLEKILLEKQRTIDALLKLNCVTKIHPSETNFILVEFKDVHNVFHQLLSKEIIVRDRSNLVSNCLRITIGTEKENNELVKTLKEINP